MKKEKIVFVRINSRLTPEQHEFAKNRAKKLKVPEGVVHREIFDYFISNHKNK